MEISSPGVYNGRGSHHTRALPKFCLPEEGERLYRREGIAFLPMVVESLRGRAGEETRGCTRSAEWPSWQEEEEAPPLGTAWHPAEAGKCRNPGKPSSHSPCTLHLHATFEWTKLQLILNVPWLHCAQFNKYVFGFNKPLKPQITIWAGTGRRNRLNMIEYTFIHHSAPNIRGA